MKAVLLRFFGLVPLIVGVIGGIYVGIGWAFIGGIVEVINQVRSPVMDSMLLALGIARIVFTSLITTVSIFVFALPGIGFLAGADAAERNRIFRRRSRSVIPLAERSRR